MLIRPCSARQLKRRNMLKLYSFARSSMRRLIMTPALKITPPDTKDLPCIMEGSAISPLSARQCLTTGCSQGGLDGVKTLLISARQAGVCRQRELDPCHSNQLAEHRWQRLKFQPVLPF